jgi:phage terminase large subunit
MGLQDLFVIENAAIKGKNGSYIFFDGLLRNVHNIKSLDDVDICWIEEAHGFDPDHSKERI